MPARQYVEHEMPSKLKSYMLDELHTRFDDIDNCIVMNFAGVAAKEMTSLRSLLRSENGSLVVVKNSLMRRAFRDIGREAEFTELFEGPVAVAYGDDPAAIARVLADWNKKAKKLAFRGGFVGSTTMGDTGVETLSKLPPLPVMQAMALGAIAAPLTSLLYVSKEVIQSFVRVVKKLSEAGDGSNAAAAAE